MAETVFNFDDVSAALDVALASMKTSDANRAKVIAHISDFTGKQVGVFRGTPAISRLLKAAYSEELLTSVMKRYKTENDKEWTLKGKFNNSALSAYINAAIVPFFDKMYGPDVFHLFVASLDFVAKILAKGGKLDDIKDSKQIKKMIALEKYDLVIEGKDGKPDTVLILDVWVPAFEKFELLAPLIDTDAAAEVVNNPERETNMAE